MSDKEHDPSRAEVDGPADNPASAPTDNAADNEAAGTEARPLPGEALAARRLELRLSVEDVSARVKLAPRQITALEANDFGALPGMATVRGFIRSYAKLLELDPEPLLASLAAESNPAVGPMVVRRPLPSPAFSGRRYAPSVSHRRSARRLYGLAVVVLVFIGTLAFIAYKNGWSDLPSLDSALVRESTAPGTDVGVLMEPALPAPEPEAAQATADIPASVPSNEAPAAVADPANALQLVLREDAWVEVTTLDDGRKLVSKLMKAGTTETVAITRPVSLVVGNAAGVDATLRGQSLNLRAVARDNVAKLSLK